MKQIKTDLYLGNCLDVLADFGDDSFDLMKYCDADGNMLWEEIVKFNSADTTS